MRARTHLADTYPHLLAEAVEVLGRPGHQLDVLGTASNLKVRWKCSTCGHMWVTGVANRSRGTGCPDCARGIRGASRARAPRGKAVTDLYPRIAAEFVQNDSRPGIGPDLLRASSQQRCLWRCSTCGYEWIATVANRTTGRGCRACANQSRGRHNRVVKPGALSAAERAPYLINELVVNLTSPGVSLDRLRPASVDRCRWRCSTCGHEWQATIANRVGRGSGCPPCAVARNAVRRLIPGPGRSLSETHPVIARQFVANLSRPGRGPAALLAGTNDLCRWRCRRGHEWITTVAARAGGSGCGRCSGNGRSKFELEVAELITAATGLPVSIDVPVTGGGRRWRVDLYLPAIDLLIDLDPAWWHRDLARDARKVAGLADRRYVR